MEKSNTDLKVKLLRHMFEDGDIKWLCSNCNFWHTKEEYYNANYCMKCGGKITGEEDDTREDWELGE